MAVMGTCFGPQEGKTKRGGEQRYKEDPYGPGSHPNHLRLRPMSLFSQTRFGGGGSRLLSSVTENDGREESK